MKPSSHAVRQGLVDLFGGRPEDSLLYGRTDRESSKPIVAGILDEFSSDCFGPELQFWPISRRDIDIALTRFQPEYLLIESAWNGNDGDWQYQLTGTSGPKESFFELIDACRKKGIPTVFWNKEDPPHFNDFLSAAKEFDYIFTTEESLVGKYEEASGHRNVDVLQFAAQPRIHSPMRVEGFRQGHIAFAGQYFAHKFPERRKQMDLLFPPAQEIGLSIYSRMLGGDANYAFPQKYAQNVVGSLPYNEMVRAYRKYKVFLNVNSVAESKSMCARRIFELGSSKTSVVSAHSSAIGAAYPSDEVFTATTNEEAHDILSKLVFDKPYRELSAHRAWRTTASKHLYAHRLAHISGVLQSSQGYPPKDIHVFLFVDSLNSVPRLMHQIAAQSSVQIHGITLVGRDVQVSSEDAERAAQRAGVSSCIFVSNGSSISSRNATGAAYVAAMSDEYDFAPNYLLDLRLYLEHYANTETVAKGVTMTHHKPDSAYENLDWPEDIESETFLRGAWMSTVDSPWVSRVTHSFSTREAFVREAKPVTLTDRFNIRMASPSAASDWMA